MAKSIGTPDHNIHLLVEHPIPNSAPLSCYNDNYYEIWRYGYYGAWLWGFLVIQYQEVRSGANVG